MISKINFSQQSALFARISNLAYKSPKEANKIFKKMGFKSTFYDRDGSQAYIVENDNDLIIACRGTEPKEWSDIKTDLNIDRVSSKSGQGLVHQGFRDYTDKIWEPVKTHVLKNLNKNVWLTGHSLGAAMSTLMAKRLVLDPLNVEIQALFTFGSPRVGDRKYINQFNNKVVHHRWVNDGDIVTKIPFSPWYYHCGKKHHIGQDGLIIKNVEDKNTILKIIKLSTGFTKGIINLIMKDIKSHSSELYVQHISFWTVNYVGDDE